MDSEFATPGNARAEVLWRELVAGAALAPDAGATELAAAARGVAGGELFARLLPRILDIADVSAGMQRVVPQLEELLRQADPESLAVLCRRLVHADRRQLFLNAAQLLAPSALVPLVVAGSAAYGMPASDPLRELLTKLAGNAAMLRGPAGAQADAAFRDLVRNMVERWTASQVSAGFTDFETMFRARPGAARTSRVAAPPLRVVQVALETDALGTSVWTAVQEQVLTDRGVRDLIDVLKRGPESETSRGVARNVSTPPRLRMLLAEEPLDTEAIDRLLPPLQLEAAAPLLDALAESSQRTTRRAIMDRLVRLGPGIQPFVLERLHDKRWYVVRNMISLLREAGCSLAAVPLREYATHADGRVRRETLQLRLQDPDVRDEALVQGLEDADKGVLRVALQAARAGLPPAAAAVLARRVVEPAFPPEYRVLALSLLGRTREPAALDALLHFTYGGRTLLRQTRLAPKSPEMLAALAGLARSFGDDRRARELRDLAQASKDAEIRGALRAAGGGET